MCERVGDRVSEGVRVDVLVGEEVRVEDLLDVRVRDGETEVEGDLDGVGVELAVRVAVGDGVPAAEGEVDCVRSEGRDALGVPVETALRVTVAPAV